MGFNYPKFLLCEPNMDYLYYDKLQKQDLLGLKKISDLILYFLLLGQTKHYQLSRSSMQLKAKPRNLEGL